MLGRSLGILLNVWQQNLLRQHISAQPRLFETVPEGCEARYSLPSAFQLTRQCPHLRAVSDGTRAAL